MSRRLRGSRDPVPFDPEIEATARRLNGERRRRLLALNQRRMANRPLREYAIPNAASTSSISRPAVEANNFELKTGLIVFIQQDQFSGSPMENPNDHINSFLEKCDTVKINGASEDAIRLRLFPFSLRDKAKD